MLYNWRRNPSTYTCTSPGARPARSARDCQPAAPWRNGSNGWAKLLLLPQRLSTAQRGCSKDDARPLKEGPLSDELDR